MKKAVVVLTIMYSSIPMMAQNNFQENKKFSMGFNLGMNYSNVLAPQALNSRINNGVGFRLGLVMSEDISKNLSLSPKVELSFNDCNVAYSNGSSNESKYLVYPVNLDLMIHLNYKLKNNKYEPYILAGPNVKLPLVENRTNAQVYGNNPDLAIDLGFGLQKKLAYFNIAPELRYSFGLLNINKDPSLKRLYFHNITLVLNFKG